MYDHQTKTSGRGRGKGDFRRREKKSGIQYYCQSGEYKRSEYLHLFQGKRCTENLYCKCKKNKTGKYRTVSADETAVSEEQQKNQEYIKKNGIGRFIRYVRNSQLKDGDQDYEDWLKDHVAFRKELKRQRNAVFSYSPLISIVMVVTDTDEQG